MSDSFDRRLIAPLILGSVLNPVNSSMIAVSLVPIGVAFGAAPSQTVWLVSALYLATAVGQPVVGRLVDSYGPRRLYLVATALVGAAGLLGALAPSLGVLVAARVLLGFGTCAAYPAAMSLIKSEAQRTGIDSPSGVLTALTVSSQVFAVVGPTLGGLLIAVGGWRTIFTVNVPLSLACLVLGTLRLPRGRVVDVERPTGLDLTGMALFTGMLTTALLFVMAPRGDRWWLPVLAVVLGAGFVLRQLRVPDAFIDLRVLGGNGPLVATYVRQTLNNTASYAFLYGVVQWLEEGRGLDATRAGLLLLPVFVTGLATSVLTGRRPEVRAKLVVGSLCAVAGSGILLLVDGRTPIWVLAGVCALTGVTQGLVSLANQNALYHQADVARIGASAGLLRTFMYAGAMIASALVAASFPHRATTPGLHHLAGWMLACAVLLTVTTVSDRSLARIGRDVPHEEKRLHAADHA